MTVSTAALVGATGGAGTTRLAVEVGATLARDGREVAILDAAFATEGLARHIAGRIDADVTKLLTAEEESSLAEGLYDHDASADLPGRLALCPARASFERMARAKTAGAAERFGDLLAEAVEAFDHVLVDVPPVASNQAVAAVTEAERVAVVAPATDRGVDAVGRLRGRLADVGTEADAVVANRVVPEASEQPLRSADAAVPESEVTGVDGVPSSVLHPETAFAPAVANAAEVVCRTTVELEFEEPGLFEFDAERYLPDALT
ncbi:MULTISPECIES: AAA family ATPase [Halorussus]|uniref:AAA family ATPase n=1 Tax=Halorussus TaxID=1070314 RepID=UPI0020A09AD0|nr:AAA family ATPase [Halorussus vallis]USZ74375.1 ParA family protein [Halorussus vallis]